MGVAFGRHGAGYRLSIDKRASWMSVLEKLEAKFDQRGDVGAVGVVRDEDGCEIQDTHELVDGDRIFVCREGEEWPLASGGSGGKRATGSATKDKEFLQEEFDKEEQREQEDMAASTPVTVTESPNQKSSEWSSSTYEAPFFRDMRSEDPTPTVFETRENESLSVTSVGGVGRLVVT